MVDSTMVQYLNIFGLLQLVCFTVHGQWSNCNIKRFGNASIMTFTLKTASLEKIEKTVNAPAVSRLSY
jgi:hypothetical protein